MFIYCFSLYLPIYLSIYPSIHPSIYLQVWKRSYSARLPQFFKLTTSKTKLNEANLRDFLQKWKVECRADGLVPMHFAIFPLHLPKVLRLPRKADARSYEVLAPVTQNHLSKPEDLMLQTLRRPRETTSERPKVVRTWRVLHIVTWKCASHHNGVHFFDISTSKSGPSVCFIHFNFEMCFVPQRRATFSTF